MADQIIVQSSNQNVYVSAPGPQGPSGSANDLIVHLSLNNLTNAIDYPPREFSNSTFSVLSGYVYWTFFTPLITLEISTISMFATSASNCATGLAVGA